jgi:hypothetical protein
VEEKMDIKLNLINQSNDHNNSEIVIFQKNHATDFEELVVAWRVIQYLGQGDNHPFTFPMDMYVSASDSYGNCTPKLKAEYGQLFHMVLDPSGDVLKYKGPGSSLAEVALQNDLQKGTIDANIFKDGKLLATKTAIAPQQKAVFEFKPTIFIGVASEIVEGQVMNSAVMSSINTELSLLGLASADIIMTGGTAGPGSTAFEFNLQKIYAGFA